MKRLNKKGFTLIELLAVIIILGVLMIIAIPSVTTYIQNSRKSAYVDTSAAYVEAIRTKVNEGKDFQLFSTATLYLIPVGDRLRTDTTTGENPVAASCISVESGGQSPFSDKWNYAYVGVTYNGKGYSYYYIGEDGAGQGLSFMPFKVLTDEGTGLIYSSSDDAEYTTPVTSGVKLHAKMSSDLQTRLKATYAGKANLASDSTEEAAKANIPTADETNILAVVNTNEPASSGRTTTVSRIEILGTCHS